MKVRLYLKRKIAAAHFLPDYAGPCRKMHGHTFLVEVWLEGPVDPVTGILVDFRDIKRVIDTCDHCTLNDVLPEACLPPTAENLAMYFLDQIPYSVRVRVWESDNAYAEVSPADYYTAPPLISLIKSQPVVLKIEGKESDVT